MRINHNMMALNTYRQFSNAVFSQSKAMEKLSSGLRINRAGDDAAGLAISEKMRGQIRGLEQAARNAQDSISMIQTAEGAASVVHEMLQRARELAVQSANGTLTDSDRKALNDEVAQLKEQINNTAQNTEFNTIKLLNKGTPLGSNGPVITGVSSEVIDDLMFRVPRWIDDAVTTIKNSLGIDFPANKELTVKLYSNASETRAAYMSTADGGATLELGLNLDKLLDANGQIPAGESGGQFDTVIAHEIVHAVQYTEMPSILNGGISNDENWFVEGLATAIQGGNGFTGVQADNGALTVNTAAPFNGEYDAAYAAVKTLHEITAGGINAFIDRLEAGDTLDQAFANTTQQAQGELAVIADAVHPLNNFTTSADFINWFNNSADVDAYLTTSSDFDPATSGAILNGSIAGSSFAGSQEDTIDNNATIDNAGVFNIKFDGVTEQTEKDTTAAKIAFHIGANSDQTMKMTSVNLTASGLRLTDWDISNQINSEMAIEKLDRAIQNVSSVRSFYGALQNRLEHAISNLQNSAENLTAAESRIRDVDMAKEMMNQTKSSILSQAAQAMLAQANQAPQGVLQLLR
ncbi:hypothetical protein BTO30_01045 [Domibacillus antri]|uniref:Flagellin n=1 Tax=Domibacillus antri TaxID=1714264 RepID=A0A1Q8Q9T6_9BACI|nr:flagellinolysin [Domibacillus antri]OLN24035.1 hypothetical protein BTO30_01045 [Domibacillus antri]